jgi:hypothetical protein
VSEAERLERVRNRLVMVPLVLGFYYIFGVLLVTTMSGNKSVPLMLLAVSPGILAMAFSFGTLMTSASTFTVLRYRVPLRYRDPFADENADKLLPLLAASPRAAVVALEVMKQDREAYFAARESGLYRFSAENVLIWDFFADEPDSPVSSMIAKPLSRLDEASVPWTEVERLILFGFRYSSGLPKRGVVEAQLVGEMTAAFMDSTLAVHDAVNLVHSHGADVAKLMFSGISLEYATELARPVDSEAW